VLSAGAKVAGLPFDFHTNHFHAPLTVSIPNAVSCFHTSIDLWPVVKFRREVIQESLRRIIVFHMLEYVFQDFDESVFAYGFHRYSLLGGRTAGRGSGTKALGLLVPAATVRTGSSRYSLPYAPA